jgi:hypothetical protein
MSNLNKQTHFYKLFFLALACLVMALTGCGAKTPSARPDEIAPSSPTGSMLRFERVEGQPALEVWVDNVTNFYALDLEIHFDPAQLQAVDANPEQEGVQIAPGRVPAPDFIAENKVDNQAGIIRYVVTQMAPREGFDGSGLVATITWQGEGDLEANVSFGPVILVNQNGEQIEAAVAKLGQ